MKNLYSFKKIDHLILSMLLVMVVVAFPEYAESQTLKPFTQRTSIYSPTKQIYKIKGDFTMVGNTNMTLVNYGDETNNSNLMRYVDVDGVAGTLNSSSSTLTFSTENGANPNCSNIIYAGLYWTGRANDGGESPLTVSIPGGTSDYLNGSLIKGYTLSITQTGSSNDLTALYTFTPVAGGDPVVFTFYSTDNGGWSGTLTVKVGAGAAVPVPFAFTTGTFGDNWALATLTTPYTIGTGSTAFQVNTLRKARENNTIDGTFYSSITTTGSTLNKLQVKLRHGSDAYQTVTANVNDIFYPSNENGNMYSAYAEVTDYVQEKGLGVYTVADIALREGDGGGTGFFGGWGMIVVYENPLMKDRDVTIFDGHAYVYDELGSDAMTYYTLPISGFNTAREGHITLKYGLIAGEGDRNLGGSNVDRFSVRNHSDDAWVDLSHPNNSTDNFFYSSIYTGGNSRNPEILNNTGMDLVMDTVTNLNNAVITTNQTSTTFQYGTNQDTYIIFCIAMSVNAYRPEVEGLNSAVAINSVPVGPPGTTLLPGDVVTYEVQVRNKGNEAIENGRMVIPVPFTAVEGLVVNYVDNHLVDAQTPYFDENEGANGSIIWEMGTLPVIPPPDDDLLGVLDFSFTVTTDCATLALVVNEDCTLAVDVDGTISGVGAISGNELAGASFITGYDTGECEDLPIYEPVSLEIDALEYVENNCGETNLFKDFPFCKDEEVTIPITEFTGEFPAGSRFYDEYPVVATSTTEYTISNPFPATLGTNTYYALFPGTTTCYYQFTISVVNVTEPPVPVNAEYCVGATAGALTATTTDPSYSLFFYNTPGGTATSSITPSTAAAGTFTYWVAQGVTGCVGPTATITVTVNPLPELTCPQDISVNNDPGECEAEVEFSATVGMGATLTYTFDGSPITSPYSFPVGVTTVTATAENDCGQVTCTFTVTVTDNEKPVITTTAVTGSHLGCNPVVTPPVFTGSDNCGGIFSPVVNTDGDKPYDGFCDRAQTWTATYTDNAGNVATEVSVTYIWTEDGIPPVIETTAVSGDLGCNPLSITTPTFTIQLDQAGCILTSEIDVATAGPAADAEGCGWSQSWTANITDQCGNVATPVTITYTWTVDNEMPVISTVAESGDLGCNPTVEAPVFTGLDNCEGVFTPTVTTAGPVADAEGCGWSQSWAANYTDACGNVATEVTITYTWTQDTELPVITLNGDAIVTLCVGDDYSDAGATANDNCSGALTPTVAGTVDTAVAGTYTLTFSITDDCDNAALQVTRTVIVSDYPELNITGATANGEAMAGDLETGFILDLDCSDTGDQLVQFAAGTVSSEPLAAQYFGLKLTGSTVSAADLKAYYAARGVPEPYLTYLNNAADGINPFVYINGTTVKLADAAKHDIGGADVDMTIPGDFPFGTYTVTGTIVDESGCETPVTLILKVQGDRTAPELTITGATANGEAMPGDLATGFILDLDCSDTGDQLVQFASGTVSSEPLAAQYFGLKLTGSTVSAADLKAYYAARGVPEPYLTYLNNAADGINPFVYINGTTVKLADAAKHDIGGADVDMTIPGDFPFGTYTVTGTIVDESGCETPVTLILKVQGDRTAPELTITGATANGEAMAGDLATGFILDLDCSDTGDQLVQFASGTVSSEPLAAQYFGLKLTGSTVSAADLKAYYAARGVPEPYLTYLNNAADGINPFVYINGTTVKLADAAKHDIGGADVDMTIPGDFPFGTYTVTGTIVDESGCETPVTLILKVQGDRTPPEVTIMGPESVCPASETVFTATEGMETYLWSVTGATISGTNTSDNVTIVAGTTCSSTFELTLSVTAPNGCYGTATKTVTVDVADDFTMSANTMTTVACIDDIVVPEPPVINDACGAELVPVALPEPEAGLCGDEMVYAWTYEDCAGHLHTWTHTIKLEDDEYPEITCPNDISVTVADGATSTTVTVIPATATDNCSVNVEGERSDALALAAPYPLGVTTITWTATDWCGNAVTCTSTVTVMDRPHISGTVFHDKDRLDDGMVDGTGTDGEGLLYVNLVNATDLVVASVKVNSDGTYGFSNVDAGTYALQLTVNEGTAGSALPATALPANWINTGENLGAGAGSDGTPDGILTVTVNLEDDAEEANFGIVKEQDVTVSLTATPNVMAGTTNFLLYIKITELNGVDTQDTITVLVPKDTRWSIDGSFNTSLTMLGSIPVNNDVWTIDLTDPDYYVFKTTAIIQAGQFSTFGFHAIFSPGNASGISTITAQIKSGSGGENKVNNNVDSEKIDYFVK